MAKREAKGNCNNTSMVVRKVIEFLQHFMPVTLAKRMIAMVLLAAGVPTVRVTELTGLCDRSARGLLKCIQQNQLDGLFAIKRGSGKKSKTSDMEREVIADIEKK